MMLATTLAMSACATGRHTTEMGPPPNQPKRVVLISIDGLRPEFYLSEQFNTPNLHAIAREGVSASGVRPVFPSQTYPNHATLLTGVLPRKHGIYANRPFSEKVGPSNDRWYWYASDVKALTLWQSAKNAGRKVAILRWPSTIGANVDWILPEIFGSPGVDVRRDSKIAFSKGDPAFIARALHHFERDSLDSVADLDALATGTARMLLESDQPDLVLVHLIQADLEQHNTGRDSEQTRTAVENIDRLIGQIRDALDPSRPTDLLIVGDHGFADYNNLVHLNTLFAKRGWLAVKEHQITRWTVVADVEGPQAAIYVKKPALRSTVTKLLRANASSYYKVLDRAELNRLGAYPGAACAVVANKGYAIASNTSLENLEGPLLTHEKTTRGQHGYDSDLPEMQTGFLAMGPGIAKGRTLGAINILDVAPTVASLLGVALPNAQRAPLDLK